MSDVIVIGGGIAGLAAAYELHTRGVRFTLLEAGPRLGGVILTEHVDGFTIDGGPDALLVQKPAAIELCRELGLGDRLMPTIPPRAAFIVRNRRLHALPEASVLGIPTRIAPLAATPLFSIAGKARMAVEPLIPRASDPARDESIGSFMGRRFGREAVEYLAEPLLAGIHAGDVDRLSMRALFPRLLDAEAKHGSVMRAFRRLRTAAATDGAFRSLPGGIGELVSALTAVLPPASLRTGTPARSIRYTDGWRVELVSGETLRARTVIVATPAFVAADLMRAADAELTSVCGSIPYASTATIAFGYRRADVAHPLRGSGFVVPRVEKLTIMAGTWVSSKWAHRAPDGHVLLRAFVGGARDPGALERSDDVLVSGALRDLTALLDIRGDPVLTRVYRWVRGSAQHEVGHLDKMAAIDRRLAAHRGLYVTGSGFRAPGIPDCIADGRATASIAAQALPTLTLT
jgi:protoporphyrinogen/coproporphyrinogen III oxidase